MTPVIVSAVRTAVGKAPRGTLSTTRPDELAAVDNGQVAEVAGGHDGEDGFEVVVEGAADDVAGHDVGDGEVEDGAAGGDQRPVAECLRTFVRREELVDDG